MVSLAGFELGTAHPSLFSPPSCLGIRIGVLIPHNWIPRYQLETIPFRLKLSIYVHKLCKGLSKNNIIIKRAITYYLIPYILGRGETSIWTLIIIFQVKINVFIYI